VIFGNENILILDSNSINSSEYASMRQSIIHSKYNKVTLDNVSIHYKFEGEIVFSTSILRKYENIIKQRLSDYTLFDHQLLRPEYASFDIYGTTDLWYLLLFVNNMTRPDEFTKREIKVFNPAYLDLLNDIIEKEKKLLDNNMSNPEEIERRLLKDLNQPSKRILSSLYDKKIKPLPLPEKPKSLNTIMDFSTDFVKEYNSIYRNKLLRNDFVIADSTGNLVSSNGSTIIDNFQLDYENQETYPSTWKNRFRQEFEGQIYIEETNEYEIKPLMMGSSKMWIGEDEILSFNTPNFTVEDNLFDLSNNNSDFRKGTTEGWNVIDGELVTDGTKQALHKAFVGSTEGSNIASVNLDLTYVKEYEELILTTTYKSINNKNLLFSGATAEVKYTNGLIERFSNNSNYSHFNNNGNYTDAMLVITLHKTYTLESVTVNFPVERLPRWNETMDGEVFISSLKAQPLFYSTKKINLIGGTWYKIKARYDMIDQPASYFKILWKKKTDERFTRIPSDILAFTPNDIIRSNEQPFTALNEFYSYDETSFFTTHVSNSNDFSFADINPDTLYVPLNTDYTLKQQSSFNITGNRKYKIEGNTNDEIQVYKDGILWFNKPVGTVEVEQAFEDSPVNRKVKLEVVYKHKVGNGSAYFRMKMYPDEYGNPIWSTFKSKANSKVGELNEEWSSDSNNIEMKPYINGITKYFYKGDVRLADYRIKALLSTEDTTHYGNIGIMFRVEGEDEYYLYTLRRDNPVNGTQKSLISGLYKISPQYSEIPLVSDEMYKLRGKLLATTSQKYTETESNYVYIVLTENNIRVYSQINQRPIVEFTDVDSPLLSGGFGFFAFNQSNVNFSDIEIQY
jgi:hypothetical protein